MLFITLTRAKDRVTIYLLPHRIEGVEAAWSGSGSTVHMMSGGTHWVDEPSEKIASLVGSFNPDR